jgi:CRISPR-associated exonuclease Cas4
MTNTTYTSYTEDDLIMVSALQHVVFCPRQCALIHIEQVWQESGLTAEGRIMHERVHEQDHESRGNVRIEYGLPLRSLRLGLIGKGDVVEFHRTGKDTWQPFPVEYKRGKPKIDHCDLVQLCAQAICLEEMLSVSIPAGHLYYGETRHRVVVELTGELRDLVHEMSEEMHAYFQRGYTPHVKPSKACRSCSLADICLPELQENVMAATTYIKEQVENG